MRYNSNSYYPVNNRMLDSLILFAEVAPPGAPPPDNTMMFILIMLPVFLILMWFIIANPQKRQEQRMREMLGSLEKNDKVMTVGGLIGTVHSIDRENNEITLKVDEATNTKVKFHLTAVSNVFTKEGGDKK